ncbi:MAG: thioesterase II family protein [Chloroflexota bacterium]
MIADSWIAWPERRPKARLRLFCLPHAGGGASAYHLWAQCFPPEVELCAIQLPGRESRLRELPYNRLPDLVQALGDVLRPYMDLPFAILGHSCGALVAFELARHLRRADGLVPVHLFVAGRRAPHLQDHLPPFHHLPDPAFAWELRRRYGGIPDVVFRDVELMQLFLPAIRADVEMMETYTYTEDLPLPCGISAYGGRQDGGATSDTMSAWARHAKGGFRLEMFPGDHFFTRSCRALVLQALNEDLAGYLCQTARNLVKCQCSSTPRDSSGDTMRERGGPTNGDG